MTDSGLAWRASPSAVVGRADVAWATAGVEVVVHAAGSTHVLDRTAAVLWQCLDGESSLQSICADIADAFAAPVDQVAADCMAAIESWLATGIAIDTSQPAGQLDGCSKDGRTWRRLVAPPNT